MASWRMGSANRLGLLFVSSTLALAPQYVISTIAPAARPSPPIAGVRAFVNAPEGVATDRVGNVYFSSKGGVFKIDQSGVLTGVSQYSNEGYSGDGGLATKAQLDRPAGLALDSTRNLYVADQSNNVIRKVSLGGIITTVAGERRYGYYGDGGQATEALLHQPAAVVVDAAGNLYIADYYNHRIRKVSRTGIITTVVGSGPDEPRYHYGAFSGDGGPAINAHLNLPRGVGVDGVGNLYIADTGNERIRKVSRGGIITTVAGNGTSGYYGDNGPATRAHLNGPAGVAIDGPGNLYIADEGNNRVRKISPDGIISTVVGNGASGYSGDDGPAIKARLNSPTGVAVDGFGNIYIADHDNYRIRKVSPDGIITTVAGFGKGEFLFGPCGVSIDHLGNVFVGETEHAMIHKVLRNGHMTTVAGSGMQGYSGDGGPATKAQLNFPCGVAIDSAGSLYIADTKNQRIRRLSRNGIIATVAGRGTSGYSGDGGPATKAQLDFPFGLIESVAVAVDGVGNLYVPDVRNHRIRKVSRAGIITTVAGSGPVGDRNGGYSGDGGPAINAHLNLPRGVAIDSAGSLYIADTENNRVRKVLPNGIITTVAGKDTTYSGYRYDYSGDGGPAIHAELYRPVDVAIDGVGSLFIVEGVNVGYSVGNRVRKVSPTGIITTVAGNGTYGYSGDGGPATRAQLNGLSGVAVDNTGYVYVVDRGNGRIRLLKPQ